MNRKEALETLGLEPDARLDAIRQAYLRMSTKYHPDQGGHAWAFRRIREAYEVLSSDESEVEFHAGQQHRQTEQSQSTHERTDQTPPGSGYQYQPQQSDRHDFNGKLIGRAAAGSIAGSIIGLVSGWTLDVNPVVAVVAGLVTGMVTAVVFRGGRN